MTTRKGKEHIIFKDKINFSDWLPRDERKLLAYYFKQVKKPKENKCFSNPIELMTKLGFNIKSEEDAQNSPFLSRVYNANDNLRERGLAVIQQDSTGMDTFVNLTLRGWDLGGKYDWWFTKWGLWWDEYKGHWVWVILYMFISFFLGWLLAWLTSWPPPID
ncbi:MAG: hypothetical protein ACYS6W_01995 [Planctomycetota bacterium]|jgi:hypothetical protein